MSTIFRLRVILDNDKNVFRDIEIQDDANLELFHDTIVNSFGLDGMQMASFFKSNDEWAQLQEYSLFDMFDEQNPDTAVMGAFNLNEVVSQIGDKLLYVYDFISMWTFYVELVKIDEAEHGENYPRLILELGAMPTEKEETVFVSDEQDADGLDGFNDSEEDYDLGFDEEEWN